MRFISDLGVFSFCKINFLALKNQIERGGFRESFPIFAQIIAIDKPRQFMNAQQIATLLGRLQRMATRWQDLQDIPAIERDLMLARLSELYEEVLLGVTEEKPQSESPAPAEEHLVAVEEPAKEEVLEEEVAEEEEVVEAEVAETETDESMEEPTEQISAEEISAEERAVEEETEEAVADEVAEVAPAEEEMPWPLDAEDLIAYDDELFRMEEMPVEVAEEQVVDEQPVETVAVAEESIEGYLLDPIPQVVVDLSDQPVEQPTPDLVNVDEETVAASVEEAETPAEEVAEEEVAADEAEFAEEEIPVEKEAAESVAEEAIQPEEEAVAEEKTETVTPVVVPEPQVEVTTTVNLFGEEDATAIHRRKQRTILSLYEQQPQQPIKRALPKDAEVDEVVRDPEVIVISDDELIRPSRPQQRTVAQPKSAPAESAPAGNADRVVKPAVADEHTPQPVLGEVIKPVSTLSDQYTPPVDVATDLRRRAAVTDLRRAVDVNDKYRLIRDLFAGNGALYEITIRRLNEFETMEDCLLYIAEHFHWNPDSDGARLLMEALERKFAR